VGQAPPGARGGPNARRLSWRARAFRAILPRVRLRLALLTCLLMLCAAPSAASAASTVSCATPAATVLFWPKGHHAVPKVGFPSIPTPHLEVYAPGANYPSANFLLYVDLKGGIDPSRGCGTAPAATGTKIAHARTLKKTKAVTCSAGAPLAYDVRRTKTGMAVTGHAGATIVFRVDLRKHSVMHYDGATCKVKAAP